MESHVLKAMYIIVNAGYADDIIEIAREAGARGATIIHSRGEGARHESFMGITLNDEKEMIICIVEEETSIKAMNMIKERAGIKTPIHGVCFTMPIDKMVGLEMPARE